MVKIRLRRTGAKKRPHYRVVVTSSRYPRDGKFIENIGHYHPREDPPLLVIKEDRLFYWLSVGAQPSDSMKRILESKGIWETYITAKAAGTLNQTNGAEMSTEIASNVEVSPDLDKHEESEVGVEVDEVPA